MLAKWLIAVYRREWNDEWSPPVLAHPRVVVDWLQIRAPGRALEWPNVQPEIANAFPGRVHCPEWPQRMHDGDWLVLHVACRENVSRTRRLAPGMETLCDCEGESGP